MLTLFSLAACDGGDNAPPDDGDKEPSGKAEYTIVVSDHSGSVPDYDVNIELFKDGERVTMRRADKDGKVKLELDRGNYTFTIRSSKKELYYDEAQCVLSAERITADVRLYTKPEDSYPIYPPFRDVNGTETRNEVYEAKIIGVGAYYVEIDRADMAYFIFDPDEGGVYKVSVADKSIDIGYYGNPHAVQNMKLLETNDGSFEIPVYDSSIGTETSAMMVFGLSTATAKNAIVIVERMGDIPPGPPETIVVPSELPSKFDKVDYLNHRLVNVSVTDSEAKVVYSESDGFYHYGTVNGPIVYVRITSATPYGLAAFSEIETRLWENIYDENGEVAERLIYNQLINAYEAICDENGICPLTNELVSMLKGVGEQFGWWNFKNSGRNIFEYDKDGTLTGVNELTIVKGNEWMFPLCYVEEFVYGEDSPIYVTPSEEKSFSVMVRENGAVGFVSYKAATIVIKDAEGITLSYGGHTYTADENGEIRVVLKASELSFSISGPDRASVSFTFEGVATYYTPIENADFSVGIKDGKTAFVVVDKTATLVINDAEGLTVTYGGESFTPDADGRITVVITADDMSFGIDCEENRYVMFTFVNVNK